MRIRICLSLLMVTFGVFQGVAQEVLPDSIQYRFRLMAKDSNLVIALNKEASVHLSTNPELSRKIASHAASIARDLQYIRGYARSLTVIGNSYWYEGMFEFAQTNYIIAAREYKSIDDEIGLGQVYNNIGEVNKRLGDHEKALYYLKQSLDLRKNDTTLALTLYNIAEVYISDGNYRDATNYLQQSMKVALEHNDQRSVYYNYWSTGKIKTAEGSFKEALPYFEKAITGWKTLGETRSLVQTYHAMAEMFRRQDNFERASHYLQQADALERKIKNPDLRIQTYLLHSKLDSSSGDYASALNYLSKHNALKDSVYNLLKVEQISRLQTIYESERMEHENQQLRSEKLLNDQELKAREGLIAAVASGLIIVLLLAIVLYQQRVKIHKHNQVLQAKNNEIQLQKESIELQAVALMKLNQELHQLNKTLEGRIEERSQQLIIQNQKLAEYSFVNAHKLRAPVASILGLIQLLDETTHEEREVILRHLRTCSEQLDAIIQEISRNLES